jgi:hypothetical protein
LLRAFVSQHFRDPRLGQHYEGSCKRKCKQMHAEHADSDRLNDLSGRVIGCAFTVLNSSALDFWKKQAACGLICC